MYRIVLTAMDSDIKIDPYVEKVGELFKTYEQTEICMLRVMNDELSLLNEPDENNTPHTAVFIADLDGEHDAIIRLWDGDDYRDVSYYDIYEVSTDNETYCKYRGFWILKEGAYFTIEQYDVSLARTESLDDAFLWIDDLLLAMSK